MNQVNKSIITKEDAILLSEKNWIVGSYKVFKSYWMRLPRKDETWHKGK